MYVTKDRSSVNGLSSQKLDSRYTPLETSATSRSYTKVVAGLFCFFSIIALWKWAKYVSGAFEKKKFVVGGKERLLTQTEAAKAKEAAKEECMRERIIEDYSLFSACKNCQRTSGDPNHWIVFDGLQARRYIIPIIQSGNLAFLKESLKRKIEFLQQKTGDAAVVKKYEKLLNECLEMEKLAGGFPGSPNAEKKLLQDYLQQQLKQRNR